MDHIPLPQSPPRSIFEIPFLGFKYPRLQYPFRNEQSPVSGQGESAGDVEHGDDDDDDDDDEVDVLTAETEGLLDFPDTIGFDVDAIEAGEFGDRSLEEVLCFIQSWCFFGLLSHTMSLSGVSINEEQLLKANQSTDPADRAAYPQSINSQCFPALRRAIEEKTRDALMGEEESESIYQEIFLCMQTIMTFFRNINLSRAPDNPLRASAGLGSAEPSLRDKVLLSVSLLGDFLHYALLLWLPPETSPLEPDWGNLRYFPFLRQRMIDAGWCCSEIDLLDDQPTGLSTLLYLSYMDRTHLGKGHDACLTMDRFACRYEKLTAYKTLHCLKCPGRPRCGDVDVAQFQGPSIQHLVDGGNIPLVTLTTKMGPSNSTSSEEVALQGRLSAFPLSPDASATPSSAQFVAFSHVWQDGLGNRTANALPTCQLRRLQSLANDLYDDQSLHPVPFWLDTLCVPLSEPSRGTAIADMFDVYRKADVVLVLDSTILCKSSLTTDPFELLLTVRTSNWTKRLWTFQEGAIARRLRYQLADRSLDLDDLERALVGASHIHDVRLVATDQALASSPITASEARLMDAHNMIWPARTYLQQVQDLAPIDMASTTSTTDTTPSHRLDCLSMPLCWRSTSRLSDEPICMSSLLVLPPETRKAIAKSPPAQRMRLLVSAIDEFETNVLFVNRPRIPQDGMRWMPESFLGGGRQATLFALPSTKGRVVRDENDPSAINGLRVNKPGIVLHGTPDHEDMFFAAGEECGVLVMADLMSAFDLEELKGKRLAVILKRSLPVTLLALDSAPGSMGVLVSLQRSSKRADMETTTEDPIVCRYEQLVKVFLALREPEGRARGDVIFDMLDDTQEWIVR